MERWLCPALFFVLAFGAQSLNIAFAQGTGSRALQATDVFRIAGPSVVIIMAERADGEVVQGSGVAFAREPLIGAWVATNCHVVLEASKYAIRYAHKWYPATILGMDDELDLCLLISKGLPATPANIRTTPALTIGEPVYAIGAPRGLELSLSNGIVSQFRQHPSTYRLIQTTAAISAGSSGGGLFDSTGRLVGITSFFLDESQNLNFAIPATAIEDSLYANSWIWQMRRLLFLQDTSAKYSAMYDGALPGWRQDLDSASFRRWLGLARDTKGQRRTGSIGALLALQPENWQQAIKLFQDYRSSTFYRAEQQAQQPPRTPSAGQAWDLIGRWDDFTVYGDRTRIRKLERRLIVWSLADYADQRPLGDKQYRSTIRVHEIDCDTIRSATRQATYFGGQMGAGDVVGFFTPKAGDASLTFSFANPGSLQERLIAWACREQ